MALSSTLLTSFLLLVLLDSLIWNSCLIYDSGLHGISIFHGVLVSISPIIRVFIGVIEGSLLWIAPLIFLLIFLLISLSIVVILLLTFKSC